MRQFTVTTEGENRLGLRELCERYVNDQWFAAHASDELAAEALRPVVGRFRRSKNGRSVENVPATPTCSRCATK